LASGQEVVLYNIVSVFWMRIGDNFMNVFNSVTLFSHCCVLHFFLAMLLGFNFNLTYGLKPQVSGLKIATDDPFSKLSGSLPFHFLVGFVSKK